jgi:uncharacterized protein YecE (DUF72 family)
MSNETTAASEAPIRVGCLGFRGGRKAYFKDLDVIELPDRADVKLSTYRRWRGEGPGQFIPRIQPGVLVGGFAGADADSGWKKTRAIADALGAEQVLLRTPASFRPTQANRQAVIDFFGPRTPTLPVAWWADGLWESAAEDFLEVCQQAGLRPVIDPLAWDEDDPFPMADPFYWRLAGKVGSGRYTDYDFDRLLDMADGRQGTIIFTHARMRPDAQRLAQHLRMLSA